MKDQNLFPKLNFYQCQRIAQMWGQNYPVIREIRLYRAIPHKFDYVVKAKPFDKEDFNNLLEDLTEEDFQTCQENWDSLLTSVAEQYKRDRQDSFESVKKDLLNSNYERFVKDWSASKNHKLVKDLRKIYGNAGRWLLIQDKDFSVKSIVAGEHWILYKKDLKAPLSKSPTPNLRPSQRHRIECREVATELWSKHRDMTITDVIDHDEMIEVSRKSDDALYTEKTIRNWIKDLCPNRSPGRRRRT